MKKKLKVLLCVLIAVVMCCTLMACAKPDNGETKPGGNGGDNTPNPPPADTSFTRLTEYVDNTLFYDMAKTETVTVTAKSMFEKLVFTIYTDNNVVYGKQTVEGATNSSYTKELFSLADSTDANDVTTYELGGIQEAPYSSISFLSTNLLSNPLEHTLMSIDSRTDTYVKNADESKTLTHEHQVDTYYIKQVFNFTKDEKLSSIQLFNFGFGKVADISFAYSATKPVTPEAVKAVEVPSDKLSYAILCARNVASLLAQGETTRVKNINFSNKLLRTLNGDITTDDVQTTIIKGEQSKNTFTSKNGDYVITSENYSDENWSYTKTSSSEPETKATFLADPIFLPMKRNMLLLNTSLIKIQLIEILASGTEINFVKGADAETKETTFTYQDTDENPSVTIEIAFDNNGRITKFTRGKLADTVTIHLIEAQYEFDDTVEMPKEFKDYVLTDSDKALEKHLQIVKASSSKSLATIGGIKVLFEQSSDTTLSLAYDSNMLCTGTGKIGNEITDYIYGNVSVDADKTTAYLIIDSLFLFSTLPNLTSLSISDNVLTSSATVNGETITVQITFDKTTNLITKLNYDGLVLNYEYKKIEPIVIDQTYIDYILANYPDIYLN